MKTKVAMVGNPWSAYGRAPERVVISRSRARAAGPDGVQFTAPGWRPMCFKSMEAAERKIATHPGFEGWA